MALTKQQLEEIRAELEKKGLRKPKEETQAKKETKKRRPSLKKDIKKTVSQLGKKTAKAAGKTSEGVLFGARGKRRIVSQSTYQKGTQSTRRIISSGTAKRPTENESTLKRCAKICGLKRQDNGRNRPIKRLIE